MLPAPLSLSLPPPLTYGRILCRSRSTHVFVVPCKRFDLVHVVIVIVPRSITPPWPGLT